MARTFTFTVTVHEGNDDFWDELNVKLATFNWEP
jgi:hypothetical protein